LYVIVIYMYDADKEDYLLPSWNTLDWIGLSLISIELPASVAITYYHGRHM